MSGYPILNLTVVNIGLLSMGKVQFLQEVKKMRFVESYNKYRASYLSQEEAAQILGVCSRTFRRYMIKYEADGENGLQDKRLTQASHRAAPVDEVCSLKNSYEKKYQGWNVKHFHQWYKKDGGLRSYSWVKNKLHQYGLVTKSKAKGKHRKKRERSAMPGMMIHQDASTHQWVKGKYWDLVVTMDDATSEHYSMFFTHQEGTASSFQGIKETIDKKGLFCSLYTDRGSHYWDTPIAMGKVSKDNLTQVGRAISQLGINMIAAYSPQARGRSERAFSTHQGRLPNELALLGITDIDSANKYLNDTYMPMFNKEFMVKTQCAESAFVQCSEKDIKEILCEHYRRVVGKDNCVSFEGIILQIPQQLYRVNFIKVNVKIHRYVDKTLAVFHGPKLLARFTPDGVLIKPDSTTAA